MSRVELVASLLILLNVVLVARRSMWNYPVAIVGVALYAAVFWNAKLYSDMLLQGFFLVLNVYGWANWARSRAETGDVAVEEMPRRTRRKTALGVVVAVAVWGTGMRLLTDASYPWWDAAIAIASVAAQWMQARRWWESWVVWIAVDVASVGLYAAKSLWPTTALYLLLTGIAARGLVDWRRAMRERAGP